MNATNATNETARQDNAGFSAWWKTFEDLLKAEGLPEACFGVARSYFQDGITPKDGVDREMAVHSRTLAA